MCTAVAGKTFLISDVRFRTANCPINNCVLRQSGKYFLIDAIPSLTRMERETVGTNVR
jgi:hypothetical protein